MEAPSTNIMRHVDGQDLLVTFVTKPGMPAEADVTLRSAVKQLEREWRFPSQTQDLEPSAPLARRLVPEGFSRSPRRCCLALLSQELETVSR